MSPHNQALRRFGRELEKARRDAGMTQATLASRIGMSKSHVSDLERGRRAPATKTREQLDEALRTGGRLDRFWDELTGSGRQAWLDEVTELILGANAVHDYQTLVFPGYLQTENYARAIIRNGARWFTPDEVAARAAERYKITRHMAEATTPILVTVLDQTVLWRRYGSASVMAEQLGYVVDLIERDRLTLHLVPARAAGHPGVSGSFIVIASGGAPDVVYAESIHEGQVITDSTDVGRYRLLYGALQGEALDPQQSLQALREELERVNNE